jgi:hypothetical protein
MEQLEDRTDAAVRRKSILDRYPDIRPLIRGLKLADGGLIPADDVPDVIRRLHSAWNFADRQFGYEQRMPAHEAYREEATAIRAVMRRFSEGSKIYKAKRVNKVVPAKAERAAQSWLRKQPENLTRAELTPNFRMNISTWDDDIADALINALEDVLGRPILYKRLGNAFGRSDDLAVLEAFFRVATERARERPDTVRYKQVRDIGSATWFASRLRTRLGRQRGIQRTAELEVGYETPIRPGSR